MYCWCMMGVCSCSEGPLGGAMGICMAAMLVSVGTYTRGGLAGGGSFIGSVLGGAGGGIMRRVKYFLSYTTSGWRRLKCLVRVPLVICMLQSVHIMRRMLELWGFSPCPWDVYLCRVRVGRHLNRASHMSHAYFSSVEWVIWWSWNNKQHTAF